MSFCVTSPKMRRESITRRSPDRRTGCHGIREDRVKLLTSFERVRDFRSGRATRLEPAVLISAAKPRSSSGVSRTALVNSIQTTGTPSAHSAEHRDGERPTSGAEHPLFQSEQSNEYLLHYRRSGRGHRGRRLSWTASLKNFFAHGLLPARASASSGNCC